MMHDDAGDEGPQRPASYTRVTRRGATGARRVLFGRPSKEETDEWLKSKWCSKSIYPVESKDVQAWKIIKPAR